MAAFELNIKATSLTDLEQAIKDLNARFPGLEIAAEPAPVQPARRPGRPRTLAAAAHSATVGEASAVQDPAGGGDLGGAAVGDAGAVGSEAAAEAEAETPPAEVADGGDAPGVQTAVGSPETGAAAGGGAGAAAEDAGLEEAERPAAGDGADAPTLEQLKAATRDLIAKANITTAQAVYSKLGIAKPGQTPEEKIPAAMAAVQRVKEVGLDAWLKEQG